MLIKISTEDNAKPIFRIEAEVVAANLNEYEIALLLVLRDKLLRKIYLFRLWEMILKI